MNKNIRWRLALFLPLLWAGGVSVDLATRDALTVTYIDIAFIPYWFLESRTGRALVRDVIKPGRLITVHIPPDEGGEPPGRRAILIRRA